MHNEAEFEALFRRWYAPLLGYACRLTLAERSDAEDIVQGVFVRYWEQCQAHQIQSEKAYLYRMVFNDSVSFMRKNKIRQNYKMERQKIEKDQTDDHAEKFDLSEKINAALGFLPTQCREVFELSRFEQLKYREIAKVLGISEKTVESHMGKALKIMRRELADYLVILALFFSKIL